MAALGPPYYFEPRKYCRPAGVRNPLALRAGWVYYFFRGEIALNAVLRKRSAMVFEVKKVEPVNAAALDFDNLGFNFIPTPKMFVARYAGGTWQDEGLVDEGHFWIHPAATVLHYGQALFEGCLLYTSPSPRDS